MGKIKLKGKTLCATNKIIIKDIDSCIFVEDVRNRNEDNEDRNRAFIHFKSEELFSEKTFTIGKILLVEKFAACFRKTSCWMEPRIGFSISEIPLETQHLLILCNNGEYLMILPLIDNFFRCSLYGSQEENLLLVAESGDNLTETDSVCGIYIAVGTDPFQLMETAAVDISEHVKTVRLRKDKKVPEFLNYYGWCSWNAFYDKVSQDNMLNMLEVYKQNGFVPGFVILDAGWQAEKGYKIISFDADTSKFPKGLKSLIVKAKEYYGVKKFFTWQTYNGYWLGADPEVFKAYNVKDYNFIIPSRLIANDLSGISDFSEATVGDDFYPQNLINETAGMAEPDLLKFYYDYHAYLKKQGVDGVKLDAMTWIECFGEGKGGRVKMMKNLMDAVGHSTQVHFNSELINCSSCSNDYLYNAYYSNITRTSTDFFPNKPETHGHHIFTNAHTSYWMGEFVHPDWDMFQTGNITGDYHAAARAISGGPVYSTDELGMENFDIMKKLILSDGSIPLCTSYAKICLDSMFVDPSKEKKPIKFFNKNKYGGVIGAFNCSYNTDGRADVDCEIMASDVYGMEGNEFIIYAYNQKSLAKVEKNEVICFILPQLKYELFTVIPLNSGFAPIGIVSKYNCGGTVENIEFMREGCIEVTLKDGGDFIAYCEQEPDNVVVNGIESKFEYDHTVKILLIKVLDAVKSKLKILFRPVV